MNKESKARKESDEARRSAEEAAETATRNFSDASRAGQRMGEEALQSWLRLMNGSGWQKQMEWFNEAASHLVPLMRRNCDEMFHLWRTSTRSGTELLRKTIESACTSGGDGAQQTWADMWLSTVRAAQTNLEAAAQLGTRAVDSWAEALRGNIEATTQAASQNG